MWPKTEFGLLGFGRLAIMGLTPGGHAALLPRCGLRGLQRRAVRLPPCQGRAWSAEGYTFESDSDCEIILPLYYKYGLDMFSHLDAEFATDPVRLPQRPADRRPRPHRHPPAVLRLLASPATRSPLRPRRRTSIGLCKNIRPFPDWQLLLRRPALCATADIADAPAPHAGRAWTPILTNIREKLVAGVEKRLDADAPVGFLLSGGLDSSPGLRHRRQEAGQAHPHLCHRHGATDAIDLKYAQPGGRLPGHAEHTRGHHQPRHRAETRWKRSSAMLGTWDITTIRASAWACTWCASTSTSRPTSACC